MKKRTQTGMKPFVIGFNETIYREEVIIGKYKKDARLRFQRRSHKRGRKVQVLSVLRAIPSDSAPSVDTVPTFMIKDVRDADQYYADE